MASEPGPTVRGVFVISLVSQFRNPSSCQGVGQANMSLSKARAIWTPQTGVATHRNEDHRVGMRRR